MSINPSSSHDMRCWNGIINDCTIKEAVPALIEHYQLAKKESVDKVRIECTLNDASDKVVVTIREAIFCRSEGSPDIIRLSDDLQNNGVYIGQTNEGQKTQYHIKIKSADTASSNALIFLFLLALKHLKLINHCQAMIVTPAQDDKEITKSSIRINGDKIYLNKLCD